MADTKPHSTPSAEQGYDRHEARAGILAAISAATVLTLVVLVYAVHWFWVVSQDKIEYEQVGSQYSEMLRSIEQRESEQLNHYGYLDKAKGVVRLPIDRSMELLEAEFRAGKLAYNTKTYTVKPEQPAQPAPGAPANAPAAQ
jgi:hypothetical protein